jgi:hypothetical protein
MSKESNKEAVEMLDEYDFSRGVVGKYAGQYAAGTNIVLLAPDVAEAFPDAASVNEALRFLLRVTKENQPPSRPAKDDA